MAMMCQSCTADPMNIHAQKVTYGDHLDSVTRI